MLRRPEPPKKSRIDEPQHNNDNRASSLDQVHSSIAVTNYKFLCGVSRSPQINITHTSLSLEQCVFHFARMFFKKATNVVRLFWDEIERTSVF